jgi:hypothetical protein
MAYITKHYKAFDKQELVDAISGIEIFKQEDTVVTKYFGVLKSVARVSSRYEIFDIKDFMLKKLDLICQNFDISHYYFRMLRGRQILTLISDPINIGGLNFYKSFYILNSSDKSRRLGLYMGLVNDNDGSYSVWGINNMSLYKKHLTGITSHAEEVAQVISGETFTEQVEAISSLVGQKVMLSKVRDIIVDEDFKINHKKFDAFKNMIRYEVKGVTATQQTLLTTPSESIQFTELNDISLDAFMVFGLYMRIFKNQDSHIVKKETERIMSITQWFIRKEKLEELLMSI